MMTGKQKSLRRRELPVIFASRSRCPRCESARLRAQKSIAQGDSTLRYIKCLNCGYRFKLVLE